MRSSTIRIAKISEYVDVQRSYSKKAFPWDNACMESLHSILKREWLNRFKIRDYKQAYRSIFEYLEAFYNTKRIHSHCDFMSPDEFERVYKRAHIKAELLAGWIWEKFLILTCTKSWHRTNCSVVYVGIGHRPFGRCPIPIWAIYKSIVIISRPPIIGRAAFCVQIKNIWEISRKHPHKRRPLFRVSEGRNIFVGNFEKYPAKRHPLFRVSRRDLLKSWENFSNYFAKISKNFPIG